MSKVRKPSPARSQGSEPVARAPKSRRTRSVGSSASGRLGTLIQEHKESNMGSFVLSPLRRGSILSDNTDIEEPRRQSWWKKLNENTRDVMEILEDNEAAEPNNIIEELEIEVLSQEKKNYTIDLPESSDSESINSIVLPQRKLFTEKEKQHKTKFSHFGRNDMISKHDPNTNAIADDKNIGAATKELFQNRPRSKPIFPAALLNMSPDKTTDDKTLKAVEFKGKVHNIFGNRQGTKRKNMFANFLVSESEDEIPEIQPKVFGFNKNSSKRRPSSQSVRDNSVHTDITTDMELDDWKLLPSSTMVENQLEAMVTNTPKRARLSELVETKESDTRTKSTETTKQSDKSASSKNKSKTITKEKSPDIQVSVSSTKRSKSGKSNVSTNKDETILDKSREKKNNSQNSSPNSNDSNNSQLSKTTRGSNKSGINDKIVVKQVDLPENQLEDMPVDEQTPKSARVSKLMEAEQTNDTKHTDHVNTTKQLNKSISSQNKSKTMAKENSSDLNVSVSTRSRSKLDTSKLDSEVFNNSRQNKKQSLSLSPRSNDGNTSHPSIVTRSQIKSMIDQNASKQQGCVNKPRQVDFAENDDDEMNLTLEYDGDDNAEEIHEVTLRNNNKSNTETSNKSLKEDDKLGNSPLNIQQKSNKFVKESSQSVIPQNNENANTSTKRNDTQNANSELNPDKQLKSKQKTFQNTEGNIMEIDEIAEVDQNVSVKENEEMESECVEDKHNETEIECSEREDNKSQEQIVETKELLEKDKNNESKEQNRLEDNKQIEKGPEREARLDVQYENQEEHNKSQDKLNGSQDQLNQNSVVQSHEEQNSSKNQQNKSHDEHKERQEEHNESEDELNKSEKVINESQDELNKTTEVLNESQEEQDKSQATQDESQEIQDETEEEQNETQEVQDESEEEQNESQEVQDESEEEQIECQEMQDESEEEQNESQELQDESQVKLNETEEQEESEEEQNESQELQDESQVKLNETEEQEEESEEEQNESQEESEVEIDESNDNQEVINESEEQNISQEEHQSENEEDDDIEAASDDNEAVSDDNVAVSEDNEVASDDNEAASDDNEAASDDNEAASDDNEVASDDNEASNNEPNISHDTTGRNRQKNESPEAIVRDDAVNLEESFSLKGRNTSFKSKTLIKNFNIRPSLASNRESMGLSDGTKNSSAEGSGWDSHRTTRKTLRQTFGKDFTPRKSLRALVMEKSAKRQTLASDLTSVTAKFPQANSTELPDDSARHEDIENHDPQESDHEVSRRTRQTTLEMYLEKVKKQNMENRARMEEVVKKSLQEPQRDSFNAFKVPAKPLFPRRPISKTKSKPKVKSLMGLEELPAEIIKDMKYKPPKRFQPSNASWITKRLYKYLETKLEPKYDYKARIRSEKLVESLYNFVKDLRRFDLASSDAVDVLKHEMARLDIVKTHFEFYEFFHQFMPREVRIKVVPDVVNKIPLPRQGVFAPILGG